MDENDKLLLHSLISEYCAHFDLEQTRVWAWSLVTFSPIVPSNTLFLSHAFLALVLIMYMPFSKILHFGGIFFTMVSANNTKEVLSPWLSIR